MYMTAISPRQPSGDWQEITTANESAAEGKQRMALLHIEEKEDPSNAADFAADSKNLEAKLQDTAEKVKTTAARVQELEKALKDTKKAVKRLENPPVTLEKLLRMIFFCEPLFLPPHK